MRVVIVGNGIAGVTVARRVRELDDGADVLIVTSEPFHFYFRPRLPEVIAGELEIDDVLGFPTDWYESKRIDVRLSTTVASVDPSSHIITLESGETIEYDRLVIASGAHAFVPPIPGVGLNGVFSVRSAGDALAVREWVKGKERAVVIGGGLLGLETARGLRHAGLDVTVLEFEDRLLPRQLDDRGAAMLQRAVEQLGLAVLTSAQTEKIEGDGVVSGVLLKDGRTIPAEAVVVSTGIRSATQFLDDSGVEIERGVVVDEGMRTGIPDIYAVGDAASYQGMNWGIVPVALAQAEVAARYITGDETKPYVPVPPSNTLKITGVDVFSAGVSACETEGCNEYVSEDEQSGRYRKVVLQDGRLVGAIVVGSRVGVRELGAMIERRQDVGSLGEELVSETFDFKGALR